MKRTLIKDATIINEGRSFTGSVIIEDDKIAKVIEGAVTTEDTYTEIIDAKGKYLIPGVIDDHVHFREPGLTQKADITSESRAAAAGGVTSFMDMPNTMPQTTDLDALDLDEGFRLGLHVCIEDAVQDGPVVDRPAGGILCIGIRGAPFERRGAVARAQQVVCADVHRNIARSREFPHQLAAIRHVSIIRLVVAEVRPNGFEGAGLRLGIHPDGNRLLRRREEWRKRAKQDGKGSHDELL